MSAGNVSTTFEAARRERTMRDHQLIRTAALTIAMLAVFGLSAVPAAASDLWLHVRVEDNGRDAEEVSINVPMQMVEAFLPMIEIDEFRGGRIQLDDWDNDEFGGLDLREVLEALQQAPDTDFVTVKSHDEEIRVSKEGGLLIVRVDDRHDDEQVRITLPLDVVDALLGGEPDELDLLAAIQRLSEYDGGDLITVQSRDESVRVWIDSSRTGE